MKALTLVFVVAGVFVGGHAYAEQDQSAAIVDNVIKAYGGKTLTDAKSITIIDHEKRILPGQNEQPNIPDFFRWHSQLTIDFAGQRKSMLQWRVSRAGKDLERFVYDGKTGRVYDIPNQKYTSDDWYSYRTIGRSVSNASDTMLAKKLPEQSVSYDGKANFRGKAHHKLIVKSGKNSSYTLFVHPQTWHIGKMEKTSRRGTIYSYVFANHQRADGVTFAADMNMYAGSQPQSISLHRDIELNPSLENLFEAPAGFKPWGEELPYTRDIGVIKVADNAYQVGKGRSYALFVDAGEHYVVAGGVSGLKSYHEALNKHVSQNKPVNYYIVTHSHDDNLGILNDAVELGAKIVTVEEHLYKVRARISIPLGNDAFHLVDNKSTLDGVVDIHDIATAHSQNYLLVYLPQSKVIFAEDHYETQLKSAPPRVHEDMVTFRQVVEGLNLKVDKLVDGHSRRQLTMDELKSATDNYKPVTCPVGFSICKDG